MTDRQTDGQMGGIAVASTALAMRALRHAVKKHKNRKVNIRTFHFFYCSDSVVSSDAASEFEIMLQGDQNWTIF